MCSNEVGATGSGALEEGGRLLRMAASCPRCGTRPALRVTTAVVRALSERAPQERLGTYQCQRRHCGMIFELTARAFQQAL